MFLVECHSVLENEMMAIEGTRGGSFNLRMGVGTPSHLHAINPPPHL